MEQKSLKDFLCWTKYIIHHQNTIESNQYILNLIPIFKSSKISVAPADHALNKLLMNVDNVTDKIVMEKEIKTQDNNLIFMFKNLKLRKNCKYKNSPILSNYNMKSTICKELQIAQTKVNFQNIRNQVTMIDKTLTNEATNVTFKMDHDIYEYQNKEKNVDEDNSNTKILIIENKFTRKAV
ncbi:hypothetical protein A3Q56_03775 [Intoshia linei]|uniref:Uncharacterized protein n=1 Tax=Intoshia linei TaxID=1819745 RepID=A0A177B4G8_9BILA|nr:hypothetical protein A3Q56_03775 [Intoshia linei]